MLCIFSKYPLLMVCHRTMVSQEDEETSSQVMIFDERITTAQQDDVKHGFALNEDGELKDVSEIEWFNDPNDEVRLSILLEHAP